MKAVKVACCWSKAWLLDDEAEEMYLSHSPFTRPRKESGRLVVTQSACTRVKQGDPQHA